MITDQLIKEAHEQFINALQLGMSSDVKARCCESLARLYRLQELEQRSNAAGVVTERTMEYILLQPYSIHVAGG